MYTLTRTRMYSYVCLLACVLLLCLSFQAHLRLSCSCIKSTIFSFSYCCYCCFTFCPRMHWSMRSPLARLRVFELWLTTRVFGKCSTLHFGHFLNLFFVINSLRVFFHLMRVVLKAFLRLKWQSIKWAFWLITRPTFQRLGCLFGWLSASPLGSTMTFLHTWLYSMFDCWLLLLLLLENNWWQIYLLEVYVTVRSCN